MNVSFKTIRRSGDKAYVLSEISGYDERLPVILTASTEAGLRIPSDTFPYCDVEDHFALQQVLYDGALSNKDNALPNMHSHNSAGVRFFVIVLPWLSIRRWDLEFRAIDAAGTVVNSCRKLLDVRTTSLMSMAGQRTNPLAGDVIENLDGRFIHDRIHVSFLRAQEMGDQVLVSAQVEMPYHQESVIEFDFLGDNGQPLLIEPYIVEDSINHAADFGAFDRRYMVVSFLVESSHPQTCLCVTDTAGSIAPGFAMLGTLTLGHLLLDFGDETTSAYDDVSYHDWYVANHRADLPTLLEQVSSRFEYAPLFSVICPLHDTPVHHVYDLVSSFAQQSYGRWELIFVDMTGNHDEVSAIIDDLAVDRAYVVNVDPTLTPEEMFNAGMAAAEGEFVGLIRACDKVAPDTLFEYVRKINEFPDCDVLYSDADTFDADDVHTAPVLRPDFSPELLRSYNYMRDFLVVRSSVLVEVGLLSSDFFGAADYELVLRVTERARRVCHVPRILCHRRFATTELDSALLSRFEQAAGRKALVAHCRRIGLTAEVLFSDIPCHYHVRHVLVETPPVTIVVTFEGNAEALLACVRSIYAKTPNYKNFDVMVVDVSGEEETAPVLQQLKDRYETLSVVSWGGPFNRARIANFAASKTQSEFLLFLKDDVRIVTEDALDTLLGYFQSEDVGVVGPKQLFVDGTIEHAGIVLGGSRVITPLSRFMPEDWRGYLDRARVAQNVTAVTGDCMMVRRSVFDEVGGFTDDFTFMYSDVDFCLKAREAGYYTVFTPYVCLSHSRSVSRVRNYSKELRTTIKREAAMLQYLWPRDFVEGDAFYNPNLDPDNSYFALKR